MIEVRKYSIHRMDDYLSSARYSIATKVIERIGRDAYHRNVRDAYDPLAQHLMPCIAQEWAKEVEDRSECTVPLRIARLGKKLSEEVAPGVSNYNKTLKHTSVFALVPSGFEVPAGATEENLAVPQLHVEIHFKARWYDSEGLYIALREMWPERKKLELPGGVVIKPPRGKTTMPFVNNLLKRYSNSFKPNVPKAGEARNSAPGDSITMSSAELYAELNTAYDSWQVVSYTVG